jgi:hypothetical protein
MQRTTPRMLSPEIPLGYVLGGPSMTHLAPLSPLDYSTCLWLQSNSPFVISRFSKSISIPLYHITDTMMARRVTPTQIGATELAIPRTSVISPSLPYVRNLP